MNAKAEQTNKSSAGDKLKLALAVLVLAAGIVGFYWNWHFNVTQGMRIGGLLAAIAIAVALTMLTDLGRRMRHFLGESQFEMRKVVWPTREETVKTTLIILGVVVILAMLLGLIDMALKKIVLEWLLRLGGK